MHNNSYIATGGGGGGGGVGVGGCGGSSSSSRMRRVMWHMCNICENMFGTFNSPIVQCRRCLNFPLPVHVFIGKNIAHPFV